MEKTKVVEWVDIHAPVEDVFSIITSANRRMQLSPLWGVAQLVKISQDFPQEGSLYCVQFTEDESRHLETIVTCYQPPKKFSYRTISKEQPNVNWFVQPINQGTRLVYEEEYLVDEAAKPESVQNMHEAIAKWLNNIKRYSELGSGWTDRLIKWFLNRYFLKMRRDQRNVVVTVLAMHFIGLISFVMAAIALGIAFLF